MGSLLVLRQPGKRGRDIERKGPPDMCHCSMSNRGGVREREIEIEIESDSEEEKGSAAPVQA